MTEERKSPVRISLEVSKELHKEIKMKAVEMNISIKTWMMQAIMEKREQEKLYEQK